MMEKSYFFMSKPPVCYSPLLYKGILDQTPLWCFAVTDPVEPGEKFMCYDTFFNPKDEGYFLLSLNRLLMHKSWFITKVL